MAYKRQIDRLPIIPADATEHNVVCHYCIVGCGYKAYTWDVNRQGGTAADENAMGEDHPISWCKPYDGGRAWITAMGHFGAHYSEPAFMNHFVGGIEYVAGVVPGDCGGTKWY